MGCCASANRVRAEVDTSPMIKRQGSLDSFEEREQRSMLEGIESQVLSALEDFHLLSENYTKKMESILESHAIYGLLYDKKKLLEKLQANHAPFQLEKLTEIVYVASVALPKIMRKLSLLKQRLENMQKSKRRLESLLEETKTLIVTLIISIDEARVDTLLRQINEWEDILANHSTLSYSDVQARKRSRNDSRQETVLIPFTQRYLTMQTIQSKKTITSTSQIFVQQHPLNSSFGQEGQGSSSTA